MNLWFSKQDVLDNALKLYFGFIYGQRTNLPLKFLSVAQALEVLHRATFQGQYMASEEYQVVLSELTKLLPETLKADHRTSLANRLKYGNEYSLRKRIIELVRMCGEVVKDCIPRDREFADEVTDRRNYFTHWKEATRNTNVFDEETYWLLRRMKYLFEVCVMKEIGFTDCDIRRAYQGQRQHQRLVRKCMEDAVVAPIKIVRGRPPKFGTPQKDD